MVVGTATVAEVDLMTPEAAGALRDVELLRRLYADERLGAPTIAKRLGVDPSTVKAWLRRHGIPMRGTGRQGGLPLGHPGRTQATADPMLMDLIWLRAQYVTLERTAEEIGAERGVTGMAVRNWLRRHGIPVRRGGGRDHPAGSTRTNAQGYVYEKLGADDPAREMATHKGWIQQHRLVMSRHLGRALEPSETVHHVNGDRADNRLENLELRTGNHGKGARTFDVFAQYLDDAVAQFAAWLTTNGK